MKIIHRFFATYYYTLIQDCLDEKMKMNLIQKLNYHESKLSS